MTITGRSTAYWGSATHWPRWQRRPPKEKRCCSFCSRPAVIVTRKTKRSLHLSRVPTRLAPTFDCCVDFWGSKSSLWYYDDPFSRSLFSSLSLSLSLYPADPVADVYGRQEALGRGNQCHSRPAHADVAGAPPPRGHPAARQTGVRGVLSSLLVPFWRVFSCLPLSLPISISFVLPRVSLARLWSSDGCCSPQSAREILFPCVQNVGSNARDPRLRSQSTAGRCVRARVCV